MVQFGKWIQGTHADAPLATMARLVLSARLQAVIHYLPLAAEHAEDDVEYVHQLRVSTRRSMAAVKIFKSLLPKKQTKWLHKQLKRVRKAAGAARDHDVFILRLAGLADEQPGVGWERLLDSVREQRSADQRPIVRVYRRMLEKSLAGRVEQLIASVGVPDTANGREPTFLSSAQSRMRQVLDHVFADPPAQDAPDEVLHQLRIDVKQLRYSMEVFAGAFDREFRKVLYPQIEAVQEHLGDLNDHVTAIARLTDWSQKTDEPTRQQLLNRLLREEQDARDASRADFFDVWPAERLADVRAQFERYLVSSSMMSAENEPGTA